jgi:hypothetical protein
MLPREECGLFVTVMYSYTSIYTITTQEFVILSPDLKKM